MGRFVVWLVAALLVILGIVLGSVAHSREPYFGHYVTCGSAFSPNDPPTYYNGSANVEEYVAGLGTGYVPPTVTAADAASICARAIDQFQVFMTLAFAGAALLVLVGFALPSQAELLRRSQAQQPWLALPPWNGPWRG